MVGYGATKYARIEEKIGEEEEEEEDGEMEMEMEMERCVWRGGVRRGLKLGYMGRKKKNKRMAFGKVNVRRRLRLGWLVSRLPSKLFSKLRDTYVNLLYSVSYKVPRGTPPCGPFPTHSALPYPLLQSSSASHNTRSSSSRSIRSQELETNHLLRLYLSMTNQRLTYPSC